MLWHKKSHILSGRKDYARPVSLATVDRCAQDLLGQTTVGGSRLYGLFQKVARITSCRLYKSGFRARWRREESDFCSTTETGDATPASENHVVDAEMLTNHWTGRLLTERCCTRDGCNSLFIRSLRRCAGMLLRPEGQ